MTKEIRLDKWLSQQGFGSRTDSQKLVRQQRVTVNDTLAMSAANKINSETAIVCVDGKPVSQTFHQHIMFFKPAGFLTAASDSRQQTVMDLLPANYLQNRCMPVGRLDKDTTGLLLFTTDGALAHYLLSPKREVKKTYQAKVEGMLTQDDITAFAAGLPLKEFTTLPAVLDIISSTPDQSLANVTVEEGKYHQVKRMFQYIGKPVISLHRHSFGSIVLDSSLSPGQFRPLTEDEISLLWKDIGKEQGLYE